MAHPTRRRSRQLTLGAVLMGVGGPGQHDMWRHPEMPGDASVGIRWYTARAQQAEAAPFNLARRLASLDLISGGCAGWNVVATGDGGTAQGVAFACDLKARAAAKGRAPEHVLILPGVNPVIADTDEPARAQQEAELLGRDLAKTLAQFGRPFGWHDFSRYDLDAPFPELGDLGATSFRTRAEQFKALARERGCTLRQTVEHVTREQRSPFVGSPRTVAQEIQRWFEAGALDGLNITVTVPSVVARFTDEVLPILRERGVVRSGHESTTLRGNLGLPVPRNRHTVTRETGARDTERVAP